MNTVVKNIENKKYKVIVKDEKIELPEDIQKKVSEHWESVLATGANIWDGEVICVSEINETEDSIELICRKSNYSHYLYGERVGLPKEWSCPNLAAGALIETSDGYYVIGELDSKTSFPRVLQTTGGNIDKADIEDGFIYLERTISREAKEELNIDIIDSELVKNNKLKYLYIFNQGEQPGIQAFSKVKLNMTALKLKEHFEKYDKYIRENNLEVEFGKIHFLKKETACEELDKMDNPKRNYLRQIIEIDRK